jgi:hypothetical protein
MMKRATMALLAVLTAASVALVACDDEDTQQEANEQFCDDVGEFIASLRVIRDLDANSSIDEVEDARERAVNAYQNMVESSADVVDARLDDLESAYNDLQEAVRGVDSGDSIGDALEAVDDEIEAVAQEASQILNDVNCGSVGGSEGQSEE